jgi:hypothetical protein
MTISKDLIHYKFTIDGNTVEQVIEFNYMGIKITSLGNLAK